MICFPNAKINLGLHITGKRPDGYHTIESIFYPIPLKDALEVVIRDKTTFTQTGIPLETTFTQTGIPLEATPEENLVMKAYDLMAKKYKIPVLDIFLKKAIPSGAGLGGGSSDAAFMLKMLCELCKLPISEADLIKMSGTLGADCPFFMRNTPVIVTGTGDIFQPADSLLKGYLLYVVKPPFSIATKEAYAMVKPQKPEFSLDRLSALPVHEWKYVLKNDFEPSIFKKYPFIEKIKEELYSLGAIYASMSGSGSAVFGLFNPTASGLVNPTVSEPFEKTISPVFHDCFVWKSILE